MTIRVTHDFLGLVPPAALHWHILLHTHYIYYYILHYMACYTVNYMDHYIWSHLNYIIMIGITCITLMLQLLLHKHYILHYMSCYTGYYMAHYMTNYIIMIGITSSWISLHELHGGYILCYIHITISITWPVT